MHAGNGVGQALKKPELAPVFYCQQDGLATINGITSA